MMRRSSTPTRTAIISAVLLASAICGIPTRRSIAQTSQPPNEQEPPAVQRIRGIIDRDAAWAGHILLTGDTNIEEGTVTVAPGTLIEFACGDCDVPPTLTIGRPPGDNRGRPAALVLHGARESPIVIRSHPHSVPGRVVLYAGGAGDAAKKSAEQAALEWRHVRFEGLVAAGGETGSINKARDGIDGREGVEVAASNAAVLVVARDTDAAVQFRACDFTGCNQIAIDLSRGGEATLHSCTCRSPRSAVAVQVGGSDVSAEQTPRSLKAAGDAGGTAPKQSAGRFRLVDCLIEGAVLANRGRQELVRNIIRGERAAIQFENGVTDGSVVRDNYIRSTAPAAEGRYCLSIDTPGTLLEGNVVIAGACAMYRSPRQVRGNVFLRDDAIDRDNAARGAAKGAVSMALVASLPADAVFEDNLLVGPATLLAPQPPVGSMSGDEPVRVNHNTFDGLGHAPRAILANEPGRPTADIHFEHNLLLRVAEPLLDEATSSARRVQGRDNVWVPARPRLQGLGVDGAADEPEDAPINPWPGNRVIESIANLRFANVPHERIHFNEPALLARRITVKELRRQLREAYRLRPDSPLLKGQIDDAKPAGMLIDAGTNENR